MAAADNAIVVCSPVKNRVILNIKCKKCKRNVRNGILCDSCDLWNHFNCVNMKGDSVPSENVWYCPDCSRESNMAADSDKDKEDDDERTSLNKVISILQGDLQSLTAKYDELLCKYDLMSNANNNISNSEARDRPSQYNSSSKVMSVRRWESVPKSKAAKHSDLSENVFPPLQNRFQPLSYSCDREVQMHPRSVQKSEKVDIGLKEKPTNHTLKKPTAHQSTSSKIMCFSDSQGRQVTEEVMRKGHQNIFSIRKPNAKFHNVTEDAGKMCKDLGNLDVAVIIAGTNDVACNEREHFIQTLKRRLKELRNTNVLLFNVPHRYDLPSWSVVNKEVSRTNDEIEKICKEVKNVSVIDLSRLGNRMHTKHGLHLNRLGKLYIADKILMHVSNLKISSTRKQPIPLEYPEKSFLGRK